jgi:hypothetical protein
VTFKFNINAYVDKLFSLTIIVPLGFAFLIVTNTSQASTAAHWP